MYLLIDNAIPLCASCITNTVIKQIYRCNTYLDYKDNTLFYLQTCQSCHRQGRRNVSHAIYA